MGENDPASQAILNLALEKNIKEAIVLGYDEDDIFFFASAKEDGPSVLWLLTQANHQLIETSLKLERGDVDG